MSDDHTPPQTGIPQTGTPKTGRGDPAEAVTDKPQDPNRKAKGPPQKPGEIGGPQGPEPTRYGDWEIGGRCSDF